MPPLKSRILLIIPRNGRQRLNLKKSRARSRFSLKDKWCYIIDTRGFPIFSSPHVRSHTFPTFCRGSHLAISVPLWHIIDSYLLDYCNVIVLLVFQRGAFNWRFTFYFPMILARFQGRPRGDTDKRIGDNRLWATTSVT